jgi:hypothetical protein
MKTRGLGPHSRRHRLGNLDRRTFEGKLYEEFRAELVRHVGGAPNVVQTAIIERCAWVRLRLAMMDSKVASGGFTEQDSRVYLAWASTLARLLGRLGIQPATASPQPNLATYLDRNYGEAAGAQVATRFRRGAAA